VRTTAAVLTAKHHHRRWLMREGLAPPCRPGSEAKAARIAGCRRMSRHSRPSHRCIGVSPGTEAATDTYSFMVGR
jgi:hypothetical protein